MHSESSYNCAEAVIIFYEAERFANEVPVVSGNIDSVLQCYYLYFFNFIQQQNATIKRAASLE
jgi:hypothetical protein